MTVTSFVSDLLEGFLKLVVLAAIITFVMYLVSKFGPKSDKKPSKTLPPELLPDKKEEAPAEEQKPAETQESETEETV